MDEWALDSPERLAALTEVDTFPGVPESEFDTYTRLVARLLGAGSALVTFVTDEIQFFPSHVGMGEPLATVGETPIRYSFCQNVVKANAEFIVRDSSTDDRVKDNPGYTEMGTMAYAGVPLRAPGGEPLGALCASEGHARDWSEEDLNILRDVAEACSAAIALRVSEHRRASHATEVSHNLRTPLAALRLELEDLALSGGASSEVSDGVGAAVGHVDDLSLLVDALVNTTKFNALHPSDVDILRAIESMAQRRELMEDGAPGDVVIEGESVVVRTSHSVVRFLLDVLAAQTLRLCERPVTVRVSTEGNVAHVRFLATPVADAPQERPLPELLVRQIGGRLLMRPEPGVEFDLVLALTPSV